LDIKCLSVGANATNCYLVISDDNSGLIIDPGADGERIIEKVKEYRLKVQNIILTHGHFDHLGGVDFLRKNLQVDVLIHSQDQEYLVDPQKNLSVFIGRAISTEPADGVLDEMELKGFKVIHTPGHTPGGICLYNKEEKVLFSGDTIFCQGVGRTDFPGSSQHSLIKSIRDKILVLPDDVTVYPGHGPTTTIKEFKDFFAW